MNRMTRPLGIGLLMSAATVLVLVSCGSEVLRVSPSAGGAGTPATSGAGGISNGGVTGIGNAGEGSQAGGRAGALGEAGAPPAFGAELGLACASDQDCGAGLICVRANHDFGAGIGAPPGGVCTAQCQADAECKKLGPGAVCAALSEAPLDLEVATDAAEPRFCMQGCSLGAPAGLSKCHGRDAFACRPFAPPNAQRCANKAPFCADGGSCFRGYCRELGCGPRCEGDTDCEGGRHCDPSSGLCVQEAVAPTPIGAVCDPDAATTPCQNGRCLVLFDEQSVKTGSLCTQTCTIGDRCGGGHGACELPRFSDYEVGDIGYCQPTCQCDGDCKVPGDACVPWGDPDLVSYFASAGICEHVGAAQVTTLPCLGEGGSAGSP